MSTVKFFASLREDTGLASLTVAAASIPELRQALHEHLPEAARQALWADGVRLAINQQFTSSDWRVLEDDIPADAEIAFLPPVTGG